MVNAEQYENLKMREPGFSNDPIRCCPSPHRQQHPRWDELLKHRHLLCSSRLQPSGIPPFLDFQICCHLMFRSCIIREQALDREVGSFPVLGVFSTMVWGRLLTFPMCDFPFSQNYIMPCDHLGPLYL